MATDVTTEQSAEVKMTISKEGVFTRSASTAFAMVDRARDNLRAFWRAGITFDRKAAAAAPANFFFVVRFRLIIS